jgi:hypothetical protein
MFRHKTVIGPRLHARTLPNQRTEAKVGRPATQQRIIREIETLATSTDLSIRQIQSKIAGRASRGIVGEVTKRARAVRPASL